jgi:hypothetical protein
MTIFRVTGFEWSRHVTYATRRHWLFGDVVVTYVTDALSEARTRLRVRLRVRYLQPRPVAVVLRSLLPPGDLVMMRKQLLTLTALAERDARRLQDSGRT